MWAGDNEAVRRVEQVFFGDPRGSFEMPFDARVRSQIFALGVMAALVPLGFWALYTAFGWAPLLWQVGAALTLGVFPAVVAAILVTRAYARHDKPHTRIDYWVSQAWSLMRSPKPPPPPTEWAVELRDATTTELDGIQWRVATPPALSESD